MPALLAESGMADTVTITIPSNLRTILGPILVGLFLNWALLGVLSSQVYVYYLCFPNDSKYIKIVVYTLYMMEIVQTIMLSSDGWQWFIEAWGRPELLLDYHLEWFDVPILAAIIASTVQVFFAWRIYTLSKSRVMAGIVVVLAMMQGASGIAAGTSLRLLPSFEKIDTIFPVISVWLAGSAGVDLVIAVAMTYLLYRHKSQFTETQYLVSRLIRLTIETGLLTATVATVDLILDALKEHNNNHLTPAIVLAKMYTNTLMVVFNNRVYMAKGGLANASASASGSAIASPRVMYSNRFKETMNRVNRMNGGNSLPEEELQGQSIHLQKLSTTHEDTVDVKIPGPVVWLEREEHSFMS